MGENSPTLASLYRDRYPLSPATPQGVFSNFLDGVKLRTRISANVLLFRRLNLNIPQGGNLQSARVDPLTECAEA